MEQFHFSRPSKAQIKETAMRVTRPFLTAGFLALSLASASIPLECRGHGFIDRGTIRLKGDPGATLHPDMWLDMGSGDASKTSFDDQPAITLGEKGTKTNGGYRVYIDERGRETPKGKGRPLVYVSRIPIYAKGIKFPKEGSKVRVAGGEYVCGPYEYPDEYFVEAVFMEVDK